MKKSKNNNIIFGFMNLVSVDAKERSKDYFVQFFFPRNSKFEFSS